MREKRFQNQVATSGFTLPVATFFTLLIWLAGDWDTTGHWISLVVVGITAYALIELNNAHALLRIRSRLTGSTFLVLTGSFTFLHNSPHVLVPAFCAVATYYLLFRSYQRPRPENAIFYAFAFTGIGSQFFPPMLYLVPTYYLAMLVQLRSFTLRTLLAGLLGLVIPYWCRGGVNFFMGRPDDLLPLLSSLTDLSLPQYPLPDSHRMAALGIVLLLAVTSSVHFLRTSYNDKIRTRMFFFMLIIQAGVLTVLLLLQPQHFDTWIQLLIVTIAPLTAHLFALTGTRATNLYFCFILLLLTYLTLGNLWDGLWLF